VALSSGFDIPGDGLGGEVHARGSIDLPSARAPAGELYRIEIDKLGDRALTLELFFRPLDTTEPLVVGGGDVLAIDEDGAVRFQSSRRSECLAWRDLATSTMTRRGSCNPLAAFAESISEMMEILATVDGHGIGHRLRKGITEYPIPNRSVRHRRREERPHVEGPSDREKRSSGPRHG
jgi:hypothetical protein